MDVSDRNTPKAGLGKYSAEYCDEVTADATRWREI
jgi:hypothetical protein